jgi:hypothetical protein
MPTPATIAVSLADERDRARIYAIRHQVYAEELKQHAENATARRIDKLDEVNVYLKARQSPLLSFRIVSVADVIHWMPAARSHAARGIRFDSRPLSCGRRLTGQHVEQLASLRRSP